MFEAGRRASAFDIALQPPLAFFRNYILKGGFLDGSVGLTISRMNAYYVLLKFAETSGTRVIAGLSSRRHDPSHEPRLMFSLHIDTARTWRGGQNQVLLTVNGLREIGQRAALVAHPDGELRRRAAEGLELVPLAPRSEMDFTAAWRLARVIKKLQPDVIHAHDAHGVAMASLALSLGAASAWTRRASAGRLATRRFSSARQLVLAVEAPPGGLLHRGIRGDPADARGRRRA